MELPSWMHQACAGYTDLTDLECMAPIPARAAAASTASSGSGSRGGRSDSEETASGGGLGLTEAVVKAEAILANLQQRFKKDQIYVSV